MNNINKLLHTQYNKIPPSAGSILLAAPLLQDPFFSRTVILLIDYNNVETWGLVLNSPTHIHIKDFEPTLLNANMTTYWGGPVEEDSLYFLHTLGNLIPDSFSVNNGIYCGGNWDIIKQMANDNVLNEKNFRLFLGYAGWNEGQLSEELNQNNWVVSQIDSKTLFETPANKLWNSVVVKLGDKYAHWTNIPANPHFN